MTMSKDINVICNTTTESPIQQTNIGLNFIQACNGTERILFEDRSGNIEHIILQIFNITSPPCVMTLIIEKVNGDRIERIVPSSIQTGGSLVLELENLRRILIRCEGNPAGFCRGSIQITKYFCTNCDDSRRNFENQDRR